MWATPPRFRDGGVECMYRSAAMAACRAFAPGIDPDVSRQKRSASPRQSFGEKGSCQVADLLIRGGMVIDGTGTPGVRADVRVAGDAICEVGPDLAPRGERELDAAGAVVAPGFIDSHTHLDPSLFWDPLADPLPQHGVTTVLTGNCSLSLVPILGAQRESAMNLFCDIEDMPARTLEQGLPWNWESFGEYREELDRGGLAVHTAALIGHSTLRLYSMGEAAWDRAASDAERAQLARALEACMASGAYGFSTSFFDRDKNNRPVPSCHADTAELEALVDVVQRHGAGFVEFIPDQGKEDPTEDVRRVARICAERGVTSTWNGLVFSEMAPHLPALQLDCAEQLQREGVRVYPQVSPRTIDFNINWDQTLVFTTQPRGWNQLILAEGDDAKRAVLEDAEWRRIAREEWDTVTVSLFPVKQPENIRFNDVAAPDLEPWLGKSLADLVKARGGHPSDVLADWVLENDLRPGVVAVGIANGDVERVAELLKHPATIVSSSDAGAHVQMMCAAGDTTLLLTRHVRDRADLTLERAVYELTGRQAELFGFGRRGRIASGWLADLTVFSLDELDWGLDEFVNDLPAGAPRLRRPAGGYRYTIASGELTQEAGVATGARPARLLDAGAQTRRGA